MAISGADSTLGLDSQHGVELAADYWGDETFDETFGQVAGHDIQFTHEDDLCSAEGGQSGADLARSGRDDRGAASGRAARVPRWGSLTRA